MSLHPFFFLADPFDTLSAGMPALHLNPARSSLAPWPRALVSQELRTVVQCCPNIRSLNLKRCRCAIVCVDKKGYGGRSLGLFTFKTKQLNYHLSASAHETFSHCHFLLAFSPPTFSPPPSSFPVSSPTRHSCRCRSQSPRPVLAV